MSIIVSEHADLRVRKRCGIKRSGVERLANKAFSQGRERRQTTGRLRTWLDYRWSTNRTINNMFVYGDKVYFFAPRGEQDNTLVTVMSVPSWFVPKHRK